MPLSLHVRPITPDDLPFLSALYASTRAIEMGQTGWDAEAIADFLNSQFDIQHRYYQAHYPDAAFQLIEDEGIPIGRLYLDHSRSPQHLHIIDIALVAARRGQGLGTALLGGVLQQAREQGRQVVLHVEPYNPALVLYQRLGFIQSGGNGVYLRMVWPQA